jgi:hypothetical protein
MLGRRRIPSTLTNTTTRKLLSEPYGENGKPSGTGLPLNWNRTPAQQELDSRSTGTGLPLNRNRTPAQQEPESRSTGTGLPLNRNRNPAQQEPDSGSTGTGLPLNRNRTPAQQEADLVVRATQGSEVLPASRWTAAAATVAVAPEAARCPTEARSAEACRDRREVATRGRTATGYKDGTRNIGGGGQEAPAILGSTGARLLPRPIPRRPRQGRL